MPKTTTIYVSASAIGVSAKNKNFPKIADIMAARLLVGQDIDPASPGYAPRISLQLVPIVGRCPTVQS